MMPRSANRSRPAFAEQALDAFAQLAYGGRTTSQLHPDDLRDAIADLIADLGHYADRRFRKRTPFTELVCRGVGMWSAERASPHGDPDSNHAVSLAIDAAGEP
jgi:hypothetical protein